MVKAARPRREPRQARQKPQSSQEPQPHRWPVNESTDKLVVSPSLVPTAREWYRQLAATLHQAQLEHGIAAVMVTSAVPGEGKTLTTTNLALTLSESYQRRVLLIDADLRRPTVHTLLGVPNAVGLREALVSEDPLPLIQVNDHLSVLLGGAAEDDPMKTLASDRMRKLIQDARARFDWVLLDTPPVGLLPDAKVLASAVDVTLLVIKAGRTPYDVVQAAADSIGKERIFGVVLNSAAESDIAALSYGSYGYGYGYDQVSRAR
jgi:capsular exopolysaccharide synthesis family protein